MFAENTRKQGSTQPLLPAWTQRVGQNVTGSWPAGYATTNGLLSPNCDDEKELPDGHGTPFAKLSQALTSDPKWQREMALGKRVGLYKFRGEVGAGNFSKVKLAFHQLTHERVAVKIIDKVGLDAKGLVMLSREIDSMTKLHHPHIVRLYEVIETLNRVYLVMEYAPGGELYNRLMTEGPMPEDEAKTAFAQLICAVEHMHDFGLVHRDIKAENVFIYQSGHLKLGDFGFTTSLKAVDDALDTFCGSPPYAAPELFTEESYTGAGVDGWALGVILYFMVSGKMPFEATTVIGLKNQILDAKIDYPPVMTPLCCDLVSGVLQVKVSERLTVKKMKQHAWLRGQKMPEPFTGNNNNMETLNVLTSSMEDRVLVELKGLGISEGMVEAELKRGCRSPVVGAYRIIVQRQLNERHDRKGSLTPTPSGEPWQTRSHSPNPRKPSIVIIPTSPQKQTRQKLKQKISMLAVSGKHTSKSKSCCIM